MHGLNNTTSDSSWSGRTILIVEDDESGRAYLEAVLKNTGVRLLYARDGREAIETVRNNPDVDLTLMDLQMPVMDGFETRSRIKELYPHIRHIAQTAHAMAEDEVRARDAGFDDYISKPIRKNDLLSLIAKYLG